MNNTGFPEIDQILEYYCLNIQKLLNHNLVGVYLFGSLSYGDFNQETSDIDLMVIVKNHLTNDELASVGALHEQLMTSHPLWQSRIEISYTPACFLKSDLPPKEPRPYLGEAKFYHQAPYGNEWIINLYLLQQHGRALLGPDFSTLRSAIDIELVQEACRRDLLEEWLPKLNDDVWLSDPHYQSYLVLNVCRILNTLETKTALSKKKSAEYVKKKYPQWQELINQAQSWKYGQSFDLNESTKKFLSFTLNQAIAKERAYPSLK
jgi:predicted nucleotidyltransferase